MSAKVNLERISVTIATASVAQKISSEPIKTPKFEVHVPNGSTGPFYIGDSDVDDTWIPLGKATAAGNEDGTYLFSASDEGFTHGDFFDLSEMYIMSATASDAAIVQYWNIES